jgi:23S rRNA (cytosine1962-C5)-methyltransferase
MILEETTNLDSYELIDSGDEYRLERFGDFVLARPDPAVLWQKSLPESEWQKADAVYEKQGEDRGKWQVKNKELPEKWLMNFSYPKADLDISFFSKLTPFKHTGIFPEQAANWQFMIEQFAKNKGKPMQMLNLFGYTGVASVLAAKMGVKVTHVDASKPSLNWAKENMLASNLPNDAIRWIFEDCLKFIKREVRRGNKYDCILMDPPAFGRGAQGEVWKFSDDLPVLLDQVRQLLNPNFKFLIINAYAVSVSSLLLKNLLDDLNSHLGTQKKVDYGELVLKQKNGRMLSTGIFARIY